MTRFVFNMTSIIVISCCYQYSTDKESCQYCFWKFFKVLFSIPLFSLHLKMPEIRSKYGHNRAEKGSDFTPIPLSNMLCYEKSTSVKKSDMLSPDYM